MNYNRRDFLKISSASALGLMSLPYCSSPSTNKGRVGVGLQLYTVRDAIASDLEGSLKKVSELGYVNLELANYANGKFYGRSPEAFKQLLDGFGLQAISSHTVVEAESVGMSKSQQMADAHAELGVAYCIHPWVQDKDRNVESYKQLCGNL
ncbi:MAG: sugar phosphate isomerase/epimerase, partial [Bacteroidota bacterium]